MGSNGGHRSSGDDDDAFAEWQGDEPTPVVDESELKKLARSARRSIPPALSPDAATVDAHTRPTAPQPVQAVVERPAEPAPAPPPVEAPPVERMPEPAAAARSKILPIAVAVAALAVVAVWGYVLRGHAASSQGAASSGELQVDAERIGMTIEAVANATRTRAQTLAASPVLRAGVETDAATLQDLANSEKALVPLAGEVIEVFQQRGGTLVSAVRVPASAAPLEIASPAGATHLVNRGNALWLVSSAPIAGSSGRGQGMIAVGSAVDLTSVALRTANVVAVAILGDGDPVVLRGTAAATGTSMTAAIPTAESLQLPRLTLRVVLAR